MAVDREISRAVMETELALVRDAACTHKWGVIPYWPELRLIVTMYSHTNEIFIVEFTCDYYKELPPYIEFIDPQSGERGTRHAYPRSSDSLFHDSGPCICAPFSRKAYKPFYSTGPHNDWSPGDWTTSKVNDCDWSNYSTLCDMIGLIQTRISRPELYRGRMG